MYPQGISDESDDIDFQPPTPKRKVCKTRSSRSPSQSQSTLTLDENELEEAKAVKHTRFEEMATKFGFSSSLEFAEHVTRISKEERKALLEEFNQVSSKEKGKGKSKANKERGRISIKEKDETSTNAGLGMSSSSGTVSNKRKQGLSRTVGKAARLASKRAPAKRKPKRLEYLDQDSPRTSPTNRTEEGCFTSALPEDGQEQGKSPEVSPLSSGATCVDNGMGDEFLLDDQRMSRMTGDDKLSEQKSSHSLDKDQSQSRYLNIDGNSLVDRLFEDSHPMAALPCRTAVSDKATVLSESAAPVLSSETLAPSVSVVGRVKLQSDKKSTTNTDLNIDELLFGF